MGEKYLKNRTMKKGEGEGEKRGERKGEEGEKEESEGVERKIKNLVSLV